MCFLKKLAQSPKNPPFSLSKQICSVFCFQKIVFVHKKKKIMLSGLIGFGKNPLPLLIQFIVNVQKKIHQHIGVFLRNTVFLKIVKKHRIKFKTPEIAFLQRIFYFFERMLALNADFFQRAKTFTPANFMRFEVLRTMTLGFCFAAFRLKMVETLFVHKKNLILVGRAGFEPATNWLRANCSTS